jgi:hypothetical protein
LQKIGGTKMAVNGFNENKELINVLESKKIVVKELVTDAIANNTSTTKTFTIGLNDERYTPDKIVLIGAMYKRGSNTSWISAMNTSDDTAKIQVWLTPFSSGKGSAGTMKLTRNYVSNQNIAYTVRLVFMRTE